MGEVMSWLVLVDEELWQSFAYEISARELAWHLEASGVEEVSVEEA